MLVPCWVQGSAAGCGCTGLLPVDGQRRKGIGESKEIAFYEAVRTINLAEFSEMGNWKAKVFNLRVTRIWRSGSFNLRVTIRLVREWRNQRVNANLLELAIVPGYGKEANGKTVRG